MKTFQDRAEMVLDLIGLGSVGAEIGVHRGDFSVSLLAANPAELYLVDAWQAYPAYACEKRFNESIELQESFLATNNRFHGDKRVKIIREWSVKAALDKLTPELDWVYIDANHAFDFCLTDLIAWSLRTKLDGIIMGHDYIERPEENFGVIPAVEQFCTRFGWKLDCLTEDWVPSYALVRA